MPSVCSAARERGLLDYKWESFTVISRSVSTPANWLSAVKDTTKSTCHVIIQPAAALALSHQTPLFLFFIFFFLSLWSLCVCVPMFISPSLLVSVRHHLPPLFSLFNLHLINTKHRQWRQRGPLQVNQCNTVSLWVCVFDGGMMPDLIMGHNNSVFVWCWQLTENILTWLTFGLSKWSIDQLTGWLTDWLLLTSVIDCLACSKA